MRLNYGPRLKQFAYQPLEFDARLNILEGSVRSGKTWALLPKILYACQYPANGWRFITGQSKINIFRNVLGDLFNLIGPRHYSYNHQSGLLRLFNSRWMVMGAKDEGSEKYIRGATIGVAICDEVTLMPEDFWKMLNTRMSPAGARLYGTTNCDTPKHWLKQNVLDDQKLRDMGILRSMHCTMEDNPNLTEEFKASQRAMFKGLFYQRYILGQWVMAEGAIWRDCWDDALIYDDSSRPISLFGRGGFTDHWISVDCGTDHPQVYGEFWDDGTTIWLEREYFWDSKREMQQKTDAQYADDLQSFMGPNNACQVIVPPEAASFKAELSGRGLWISDANNEVLEGIQTVAALMSTRKLRIHRRCIETLKGIELYAWDKKAALRGVEQPLKQDDDAADMLRYATHEKIPRWRFM